MTDDELTPVERTAFDIATAWVETLLARGVSLRVKGARRLEWLPGSAFKEMSDAELLTYRHHRAEIIEVVRARYEGLARPAPWASAVTERS